MKYVFKCRDCGWTTETDEREPVPWCMTRHDGRGVQPMIRDYRTEAVGLGSGVKVSRDGTVKDQAKLFLPDNDEFKGPGDPDGKKGMRDWHERFAPRSDNPNPVNVGEIEKKVF